MTNPANWIPAAFTLALAVWGFFKHREAKPTDTERAALLRDLAFDAAALVMAAFPGKTWAEYVNLIVQRLLAMPDVPTKNAAALEGAANGALVKMQATAKGSPVVSR